MKNWAKAAGMRAARTVAQTAIASIGTAATLQGVDWKFVVSTSLLAGIVSVLTSIVLGMPETAAEKGEESNENLS